MDHDDKGKTKAPTTPDQRTMVRPDFLSPEPHPFPEDENPLTASKTVAKDMDVSSIAVGHTKMAQGLYDANARKKHGNSDDDDPDKAQREEFIKNQVDYLVSQAQRNMRRLERQLARIERDMERQSLEVMRLREQRQEVASEVEKTQQEIEEEKQEKEDLSQDKRELNRMLSASAMQLDEAAQARQEQQADPDATEDGSERYITADGRIVDENGIETDDSKKMSAEMRRQILESPDKGGLKSFEAFQQAKTEEDKQRIQTEQIAQVAEQKQKELEQKDTKIETLEVKIANDNQHAAAIDKNLAAGEASLATMRRERADICDKIKIEEQKMAKEKGGQSTDQSRVSACGVDPVMKNADDKLKNDFNTASAGIEDSGNSPSAGPNLRRTYAPAATQPS